MGASSPLLIGARGSPLSLAQTGHVADRLRAANPDLAFEIVPIVTSGDRIRDRPLSEAGGKGLFTKELDEALLDGRVDLAVHSMKDLPTVLPDGVVLACVPERETPLDALITASAVKSLHDLPKGARIGTASLRRQAQLLALRPDFVISMLRGNVETRLEKVRSGQFDATLLALAGLKRLGLVTDAFAPISPDDCLPAAGQGALAVTARAGDGQTIERLLRIDDAAARIEIAAERAFLGALDGSCRTPIAANARWSGGSLLFAGEALSLDGLRRWRRSETLADVDEAAAAACGARLGAALRAEAGADFPVVAAS